MVKTEKSISIKPSYFLRYIIWYAIFSMIITGGLISIGQVKIKQDESIIMYMLFNDAFRPFILILFGTASAILINVLTSENITFRSILRKEIFKFKNQFQFRIVDFILLLIVACKTVIDRVLNIDILLSGEKLQLIAILMFSAYFIRLISWLMYKGLKNQVIELIGVLFLAIKSPGYIYQGMRKEINNTPMPQKYKRMFLKPTKVICIMMVILICIMIVGIFYETIRQYF